MTREEAITVLKAFMKNPLFSEVHKVAFNIAIHDIKQRHDWDINNLILINKDNYEPLEQESEWIPVSKSLPEERDWYLAVFKEIDTGYQLIPRVADYIGNGENDWQIIDEDGLGQEYRSILECVAWMPLPKPYKADSEVK